MGEFDHEATQIRGFAFDGADKILLADSDAARCDWLRAVLGGDIRLEESDHSRRVFERLTADPPRVLVVGTQLVDISGTVLLAHAARHRLIGQHHGPLVFLYSDSPETAPQVDERVVPVFYRLTPSLGPERIRELFEIAFQTLANRQPQPAAPLVDPNRARLVVDHAKRFAVQTEPQQAAVAVQAAIVDVCRAARARVLYFDDDEGTLWCEHEAGEPTAASVGVSGFCVRTGGPMMLEHAQLDPAYNAAADDPAGQGGERIALCPVRDRDRKIHAVLIALRPANQPPFDPADLRLLENIADAWGPYLHQLAAEAEARENRNQRGDIFREEALKHLSRRAHSGDVVRINPAWMNAAYWILLATLLAAGVFGYFVQVHQYSEGAAVVRVIGRNDIVSYDSGTVTAVEVASGQTVKAGQPLARLHDTEQATKLRALDADFERKLVAYLQTPLDAGVKSALGQVVTERENATAAVNARVIPAPYSGRIKEVRVRNGQRVEAGAVVMTIAKTDQQEGLAVLAFLPGSDRPRLHAKQPLRLSLPGYRGVFFDMEVLAISNEVLGPAEATTRYLGDRFKDAIPLKTSVVVVEGRLTSGKFEAEGHAFELHDGMIGSAEVQLESKSVLATVLPELSP